MFLQLKENFILNNKFKQINAKLYDSEIYLIDIQRTFTKMIIGLISKR